jgi:hypothetical protein
MYVESLPDSAELHYVIVRPTIPSSNTNAAAIAIGENASDLILEAAR